MSQVIQLAGLSADLSTIGFYYYASEYLRVAELADPLADSGYSPVPYFLVCQALELGFKAYLLTQGRDEVFLKKSIGHNLKKCLREVRNTDLANDMALTLHETIEIVRANRIYNTEKSFNYFKLSRSPNGANRVRRPDLGALKLITIRLLSLIRKRCYDYARSAT